MLRVTIKFFFLGSKNPYFLVSRKKPRNHIYYFLNRPVKNSFKNIKKFLHLLKLPSQQTNNLESFLQLLNTLTINSRQHIFYLCSRYSFCSFHIDNFTKTV